MLLLQRLLKEKSEMTKKFYDIIQSIRESSPDGSVHNKEKVITVRHKDSGKELRVVATAAEKYKRMGYEHVKEEVKEPTSKLKDACWKGYTAIGMKEKNGRKVPNCVPVGEQFVSDKPEKDREAVDGKFTSAPAKSVNKSAPQATPKNEEVEQIEEMPGANMDTRAVHKHLRKSGWSLTRTKGSHDVYTHPKSEKHIAVPRHKQLKAPLVRGIMKDAQVSEEVISMTNESRGHKILATKLAQIAARKQREKQAEKQGEKQAEKQGVSESNDTSSDSKGSWKVEKPWKKIQTPVVDKSGAKHTAMSRVKHLAKMAARRKVTEQNDDIQTPAKKSLAFRGVVKNTEKQTKGKKINSDEKFESEPELNTQIMRNM